MNKSVEIRNNMENKSGWIYILISSSDYSRSKIGKAVNPYKRYINLRTADPTLGFVVGYYIPEIYSSICSVHHLENYIHCDLRDYRMDNFSEGKTEWFKIYFENAMLTVEEVILSTYGIDEIGQYSFFQENKIIKMYEADIEHIFKS